MRVQKNMNGKQLYDNLCSLLISQLHWRRHEDFVCIEEDTASDESDTSYTLHYQNSGKEEYIILRLYEFSEHLSSIIWSPKRRMWRNEATQHILIRECPSDLDSIYSELEEKTNKII